jgi:biopolymer transport protein ExbB/TolQ
MLAVSRPAGKNSLLVILGNLGWPLVFGLALCVGFYALLRAGIITHPDVHRYFAGHPIEFFEAGMFCVGLAALLLKGLNVLGQHMTVGMIKLEDGGPGRGRLDAEEAAGLIERLDAMTGAIRNSYLGRRLRDALEFVERKGSAEGLDDELKYLSDNDAARSSDGYALVRIIIWATPMLGFLGTVIGITMALGNLSFEQLATNPKEAMAPLTEGLGVAFDTTTVALSLSIVLMFLQFLIERFETQLLVVVDQRAGAELVGRFDDLGTRHDPHVASVERMARSVLESSEKLVEKQSRLWQETIDAAHHQWSQLVGTSTEQMQGALSTALGDALRVHAERLAENERALAEVSRKRWEQWQMTLTENARLLRDQQSEMHRQSEILSDVVRATGDIVKLESALNENLDHLAGAKNFEDTVMSLAAAIHLLNTKLGADDTRRVKIGRPEAQDRAA